MTAPALAADISDPALAAESAEAAEAAEPIDRNDATDPTDPMLAADPMEPIDRTLPREAMDRNESVDARQSREWAIGKLWLPRGDRDRGARPISPAAPAPCNLSPLGKSSKAPIAQSVERLHGKEKVYGSIPYWGSGPGHRSLPIAASGSVGGVAQVGRASGS